MNSGEFREDLGIQSARLIFELSQPEAINDPKPEHYADAGHVLARQFDRVRRGEYAVASEGIDDAIDHVNSAVGGFYTRDASTHRLTTKGQIGEHPSDYHLIEALKKARDAQLIAEQNGLCRANSKSATTTYYTYVLEESRDKGHQDSRMRKHAADALREATRSVPVHPLTAETLLASAIHSAQAIVCLAPIAKLHPSGDLGIGTVDSQTGQQPMVPVPMFKDYLAFHVRGALGAIS